MLTEADALLASRIFGLAIIALSLVPLVGYTGQFSLCQMSFAAVGALTFAHATPDGNPAGLILAGLVAGLVGALIALPALRLQGLYLALLTAAFAVILDRWVFNLPAFDIGPITIRFFELGNVSISRLKVPGIDKNSNTAMLVVLSVAFALLALGVVALRRSRYGGRLLALRDSPAACATLGMHLTFTKLAVFALSAAMAGVGGALYGGSVGSTSPQTYDLFANLPLLLVAVAGGIGSPGGALFAGLVIGGIPIVADNWPALAGPLLVLPGLIGVFLGQNPNGVVRHLEARFQPVRTQPVVWVGLAVVLTGLLAAAYADVITGWMFGLGSLVAIFSTPRIATRLEARDRADVAEPELPLEWVGIERPFTDADVRELDRALGVPV
jgi:branched-chain amino acid transport system permease protein